MTNKNVIDIDAELARIKRERQEREQREGKPKADTGSGSGWWEGTFTAADLQDMEFPPLSWVLPNIVPAEGVTMLAAKPKAGKSWMIYNLCIACAADRFTLGTIKPAQGDVLYLALEDSKRRLQGRMTKLLPTFGGKWPTRLTLKTEWRRLHEGGLDDLRAWHAATREAGGKPIMVVIDVLAKVRKPVGNRQLYEADYDAITGLQELSRDLSIAVLVVHHVRKMAADDLMETVSGSYGTTGAVDTVLVLANTANGAVLNVRGRDVESAELAVEFHKATCRWSILGDAANVHLSDQQAKITGALEEADEPMTVPEIAAATEIAGDSLRKALHRLATLDLIKRVGRGLYAHAGWQPPADPDQSQRGKRGKAQEAAPLRVNPLDNQDKTPERGKRGERGGVSTDSHGSPNGGEVRAPYVPTAPHLPLCPNASQAIEETGKIETTERGSDFQGLPLLPQTPSVPAAPDLPDSQIGVPVGRPPRAISDSPEDRREVPPHPGDGVSVNVWVSEESVIPADAVCCVCGEGPAEDLWTLNGKWVHERCGIPQLRTAARPNQSVKWRY